jgi:hypothetical protein
VPAPKTYNDGDIVVFDGIAYLCTKNGVTTPPEPWPGAPATTTGPAGPTGIGTPGPIGPTGGAGPAGPTGPAGVIAAHAATHNTGGSDPITALAGPVITSGILPDARLSANIPRLNTANIFSAIQVVPDDSEVRGPAGSLWLTATGAALDQKYWQLLNVAGKLRIRSVNDAGTIEQANIEILRSGAVVMPQLVVSAQAYLVGGIYEHNRANPLGEWQDAPFSAANYTANAGGTWTVTAACNIRSRYTVIGRTMIWSLYLSWFAGAGTNVIGGSPTTLSIAIPGGFMCPGSIITQADYAIVNGARAELDMGPSSALLTMNKRDGSAFVTGTALGIVATLTFEVQ